MADGKIVKFYPRDAAKNPDNVLEQAIGEYTQVLILGFDKDGLLEARASSDYSIGEILVTIEQFKYNLLSGAYDDHLDERAK